MIHPKMLDLFVPHQASKFALQRGRELLGIDESKYMNILETHGNCIAASIPMALHDAIEQNKIQRGGKVALVGTAAGLSLGGIVFVY
jgi:3-oxoacyl-[acyl-carrier-protein] synthase-3